MSKEEIKKFTKEAFRKYDADNSGYLDEKEVFRAIHDFSLMTNSPPPTKDEVYEIMYDLDYKGKG